MTTATPVAGTGYGSPYLDSLILGWAWPQDGTLLYYFDSNSKHPAWTSAEESAFRQALDLYQDITTLQFVATNDKSEANFVWQKWTGRQLGGSDVLGEHEFPIPDRHSGNNLQIEGDFNYQSSSWAQLQQGGDGFVTIIHELGHGLGLEHPHDGEQTFPGVTGPWSTGKYGLNQGIWTTMSYNDGWNQRPSPSLAYGDQGTPMAFDVAALQALYGANTTYHDGDDVYQLDTSNGSGTFWSCIWDAGGTDTISNSGSNLDCTIDLRPASLMANDPNAGGYVSADASIIGGFTIAHNVVIEDAIGGNGNDILIGNDADNRLEGGNGNDTLDGKGGADTMIGGAGNDTYFVDNGSDVVQEADGGGTDTVNTTVDYTLSDLVENLNSIGGIVLTGNSGNNTITGNALANTIDGLGGADTMIGGAGNDIYVVDNIGDKVIEAANGGIDTVKSSISLTLPANVENLILTGSDAINGTGNTLANTITGNDAANTLDGSTGADHLIGGDGDDTFIVDNAGDVVTEGFEKGTDTVKSSITRTIEQNVENLILTGSSAINGTGNDLDNVITGNAAANTIDGGAGNDTMIGRGGNDTYLVDSSTDTVTEAFGGGTDTVKSTATFTLSDNVENLILLGSLDIDGTGNGLNNTLTGNSGINKLDGAAGNDTMIGGAGDDTYVADSIGDKITEAVNGGTDTVLASISYMLPSNVENLTLTGTDPINGTGSSGSNTITGNDAANILDGGAGADHLIGGDGNDTYVIDNIGDVITEAASKGIDTAKSSISHTMEAEVENLVLTGSGAINGTGNELDNVITGNAAANIIDGGTGNDTMIGLGGNDTYFVDSLGDTVTEAAGGGTDTVKATITVTTLADNVENLVLLGSLDIDGTGNALNNTLTGNSGINTLDGAGGNDTMIGGAGDDTYVVDSIGDKVTELVNGGTDTILSSVSYTLPANVENLTLTGANPINGTGSSGADTITGNDADNTLDGKAGADHLIGNDGNDTYIVDNPGDVVTEDSGKGTDTINSSVTHTLEANVENLTLTGSAAIDGTGNDLDNLIVGNKGANTLDGGIGGDTMKGLAGNDTYIVDNAGDVVIEASGGGTDTVKASIDYTLGANVEKLILTGSDPLNGTGNSLANTLTGNDGTDVLNGQAGNDVLLGGLGGDKLIGGLGTDTLTGGDGADIFHFDALAEKGDTITDFVSGTDFIEIVASGFAGAAAGSVNLLSGAATPHASAATGTFLFNTISGGLFWDDDGTGAHAAQLLATLSHVHSLATGDILIV